MNLSARVHMHTQSGANITDMVADWGRLVEV